MKIILTTRDHSETKRNSKEGIKVCIYFIKEKSWKKQRRLRYSIAPIFLDLFCRLGALHTCSHLYRLTTTEQKLELSHSFIIVCESFCFDAVLLPVLCHCCLTSCALPTCGRNRLFHVTK